MAFPTRGLHRQVSISWGRIAHMENDTLLHLPHRRLNRLTGEWVLVSPHRTERPWSGLEEASDTPFAAPYDADCYLCPGNQRAGGGTNPDYNAPYIFTNDFSALLQQERDTTVVPTDELLVARAESGICRVICYSPRHDLSLARMQPESVEKIVEAWQKEYLELGSREEINYVQIFENRGLIMGCSNPHPHGQIWANSTVPTIPAQESCRQREYLAQNRDCLLCRYLETELQAGERVLFANDSFVTLVPFWAVWPYETLILPRCHQPSIAVLTNKEKADLAEMLVRLAICYDNLFSISFPYSMGIHQQPTDSDAHPHWHWHIHYFPPLLRSRSIRKHMVGYEMLAMPQRDISPESAVARLRGLSSLHYLDTGGQ